RVLAGEEGQVFVVGDDDQAIYGWRGAKVENVQKFLKDFPGAQTIRLEQNYRSSANILDAANAVIAHNPDRPGKRLWTDSGQGETVDLYAAYNEVDQARFVGERISQWVRDGGSHGDCAVLYRSNAQSRAAAEQLLNQEIPYRVCGGGRRVALAEIEATLAALRVVGRGAGAAAEERTLSTPARGIGGRALDAAGRTARAAGLWLGDAPLRCSQDASLGGRARNAL